MKNIFIGLMFLLLSAGICQASPFLVSDPSVQAVGLEFEVHNNDVLWVSGGNQPDGSIKVNLSDILPGNYIVKARYLKRDPLWGISYSEFSVPFSFVRPGTSLPVKPVNPKLLK